MEAERKPCTLQTFIISTRELQPLLVYLPSLSLLRAVSFLRSQFLTLSAKMADFVKNILGGAKSAVSSVASADPGMH